MNKTVLALSACIVLAGSSRAADDKGTPVTLGGLKSTAPATWKPEKAGQMRAYQFKLPKAEGDKEDTEVVIFFFGPGGGGSVAENIKRWKGFFIPPEGKSIDDVAKVSEMKAGDANLTYLDVEGTYKFKNPPFDPNAKEELKPNSRMLGVVFQCKDGPYFIRCVGPAKTVSQHKQAFDDWLKAFK